MRALFVSLLISCAAAGAAFAQSTAVLAQPADTARPVVVDGRVWRCDGATCNARGQGRSQGIGRECARVARKLGPLVAYTRDAVTLDREGLERCNREARVR